MFLLILLENRIATSWETSHNSDNWTFPTPTTTRWQYKDEDINYNDTDNEDKIIIQISKAHRSRR